VVTNHCVSDTPAMHVPALPCMCLLCHVGLALLHSICMLFGGTKCQKYSADY